MQETVTQKHDTWAQHIEQWRISGKTQADYCREHDLKLHQFIYWRGKLKPNQTPPHEPGAAFVPVAIASQQTSGLILGLPNGYRIEGITSGTLPMVPQLLELLR